MDLVQSDREHFLHPFTSIDDHQQHGSHVIQGGEGIHVVDIEGNRFIDAVGGLWCVNVGYGNREIVQAVTAQMEQLCFFHSFMSSANEPAIRLSDHLARIAPTKLNRVFFSSSGSEANDTQIKIVRSFNNLRGKPTKKKIISRQRAYHGSTLGAASLTGLPQLHTSFDLPDPSVIHVSCPHPYWNAEEGMSEQEYSLMLAAELEQTIEREGADTIAAFIAEPVMGAGGVVPPPAGYFEAIIPILRQNDVLFIADEVVSGFGRLGTMFGSEMFGLEPDLMTLAKGLTSGYVPMSACLITDAIFDVLRSGSEELGVFGHGYTYSAHPVAAAAALANIQVIERDGLVENAARVGKYLHDRLRESIANHPLVGEVRGVGLIAGIELVANKETKQPFDPAQGVAKRVHRELLRRGLIVRPIANTLALSPPLILTQHDVDEIVDRIGGGLDVIHSTLGGSSSG